MFDAISAYQLNLKLSSGHTCPLRLDTLLTSLISMIIDILILLIPIPLILKLQVRTSDKFMLAGIFMLGGL